MFTEFQHLEEMRDVVLASQLWPMMHAATPWVHIHGQPVADGGFTNLTPMPSASPCFIVKRSSELGSARIASSENDVIAQVTAGYKAAHKRHIKLSALKAHHVDQPVFEPQPVPRYENFKSLVFRGKVGPSRLWWLSLLALAIGLLWELQRRAHH